MGQCSLLWPNERRETFEDFHFVEELRIAELFLKGADYRRISLIPFFTRERETVEYRLALFAALMKSGVWRAVLAELLPKLQALEELQNNRDIAGNMEAALYAVKEIELYTDCVETVMRAADEQTDSAALQRLLAAVRAVWEQEEYRFLKASLTEMERQIGGVRSITLGVNLDAQLRVVEAGVVSVNDEPFVSGNLIDRLLRLDLKKDGQTALSTLVPVRRAYPAETAARLNAVTIGALNDILLKSVSGWRPAIRRYLALKGRLFAGLAGELPFVLSVCGLLAELREKRLPVCVPEISEGRMAEIHRLYHPLFALRSDAGTLVKNDIVFDEAGMIYILTGANNGGKSVFTASVGLAYAMLHLGVPVPAAQARMSLLDGIYTHFPKENGEAGGGGRFESECVRVKAIADRITGDSLFLFDELFSGTGSGEGAYIAAEVIRFCAFVGARGVFATHLHSLAETLPNCNGEAGLRSRIDTLVAAVDEKDSARRTYRICRCRPDGRSYAYDIARKYDLTFEQLAQRREEALRAQENGEKK